MRLLKIVLAAVLVIAIVYLMGPHPQKPVYTTALPVVPAGDSALEAYIKTQESYHHVKPDNEARIVWADSTHQLTEYAIVYLHGFSASQEEGNPVHRDIAKQFGCNLYLARLSEHGIDTSEALLNMTAESLWTTAQQAYAIGKQLGKKVILMGTSTGGTLALQLAAAYPDIAALILYSPNIAINDPNAWILNNHWGLQIARMVKKGNYNIITGKTPVYAQYWNQQYRLEATVQLEELLETTMTKETFSKVKQPVLTLYYYKDEEHQDKVVKVSAMKEMFAALGTPADQKKMIPLPEAGSHVLASPIQSKDVESVKRETQKFMQEQLHLQPVTH
jgi:esterase/lipase